tara:strand:+ start:1527 stop:2369 length:843 start_codon:yes stop_codon:yes gene_type:complete
MKLNDFNDRHLGETIYIIGCAPSLNNLTKKNLEALKNEIVIGVNFSHTKIKSLDYMVTGHIDSIAYMLEYGPKGIPIFAHKSDQTAYATEVWDNERVVPMWDLNLTTPLPRHIDERNNIHGSCSILLSATHLAYIMGASKIVYLGFEENSQLHFYNVDRSLETQIISNIEALLESKKYWNSHNYSPMWRGVPNKLNVHSGLEVTINKCKNAPSYQPQFNRTVQDLISTPFGTTEGALERLNHFKSFVEDLNKHGVETWSVADNGITLKANCKKISLDLIS